MYKSSLAALLIRDLNRLSDEINNTSPDHLYKTYDNISNSIGNLTLHICGNLNHFVSHSLGEIPYKRDREKEFNSKSTSSAELIKEINTTINNIQETIGIIDKKNLDENYPIKVFSEEMTCEAFLIHLYGHLNYHLGQINYLRRFQKN
jgi:uncharacterized damage-inducible protein DinB